MSMKYKNGFIALTTVLILSAIFLSLSISIATHAILNAGINVGAYTSAQSKALAEACVEYAQIELSRTLNYDGDESILIDDQSCYILPISGEGNTNRVIQTESIVDGFVYRIEVELSEIQPEMQIASYEAKVNF